MIAPESSWKRSYANLDDSVDDKRWVDNIVGWISAQVSGFTISNITPPPVFSFNGAPLKSALLGLRDDYDNISIPAATLANGFVSSVSSSIMTVASGSFYVTASPSNIWSAPPAVVVNPASLTAASNYLKSQITNASEVDDPLNSVYPVAIRSAFLKLKYDITGINSITPTPSPLIVMGASTV